MDRSLRRLGQLLVVMGALLGAVLGVALALVVDNAGTGKAVAIPERRHTAVLAAEGPSSQPPASRPTRTTASGAGSDASSNHRAVSGDRTGQRGRKADKAHTGKRDKPAKGNDKPAKSRS